jgi:hypothetical protein
MMKVNVRSHTGKIGHLPYEIRCQLGRAIHNGVPGVRLVAWLNSLPEVQAILSRDFGGRPIKEQNLSKWKARGYPDWLQERAFSQAVINVTTRHIKEKGLPPSMQPNLPAYDTSSNQS